jgi:hypothetical protein
VFFDRSGHGRERPPIEDEKMLGGPFKPSVGLSGVSLLSRYIFRPEKSWALRPTQVDEKPLHHLSPYVTNLSPCHLDRSEAEWRDLQLSQEQANVFFDRRPHGPDGPPKWMKKPLLRFTHELVISTEAKRSGEICGSFSG